MLRYIEELSMNAWPALQTVLYDGWVLRFAKGYTKRANSINPIYPSTANIEKKIERCEELYQSYGIDAVYKLTSNTFPENLDAVLAQRGYSYKDETVIQIMEALEFDEPQMKDTEVSSVLTDKWLDAFCRMAEVSERNKDILKDMLNSMIPEKYLLLLKHEGKEIGCGIGVLEDGFVGIYEIVIDEEARGKGFGKQLMLNMLKHAYEKGAGKAYLQAVAANTPAVRLYESLGFREAYRYWYRVKLRR